MPAVSEKQRGYLNANKGHAWVKAHHYDNKGPLPVTAAGGRRRKQMITRFARKHRHGQTRQA